MLWNMHWVCLLGVTLLLLHCSSGSSTKTNISESASFPLSEAEDDEVNKIAEYPSSSLTPVWKERMISNKISQYLEGSLMSLTETMENSGDGSGFQGGFNELTQDTAPSVSLLEENMFPQELDEQRDWVDTQFHLTSPLPQQQIQLIDGDEGSSEITETKTPHGMSATTPKQTTSTLSFRTTTSIFSPVKSANSNRQSMTEAIDTFQTQVTLNPSTMQTSTDIQTVNGQGHDDSMESNTAQGKDISIAQGHSEKTTPDGTIAPARRLSNAQVTQADSSITSNPHLPHLQNSSMHMASQTIQSNQTGQKVANSTKMLPNVPSGTSSMRDEPQQSPSVRIGGFIVPIVQPGFAGSSGPCLLDFGICVTPTGLNGTTLQWEDLSRTLAFAWELHVFGCAALFLLLVGGALWGITGVVCLHRPYCVALSMANVLLLLAGGLRCAHFLVDPYGTRYILPQPALSALYNLPLPLLLWAQAILAMIVLRGQRLNLLPPALQRPQVAGGLVVLHCTLLFAADMLSQALSPALPLMLQTLSLCWGLPLCLGLFFQTLSPLHAARTFVPQWTSAKRTNTQVRRVFSFCTFMGALSYALQIHGLLWLYGLLGDWRRFTWGWWLCQFTARLLELAWSYSLLLLASRVFWRSRWIGHRGDGKADATQRGKLGSCWDRTLEKLPKGPDRHWAKLIPNNWEAHQHAHVNISGFTNGSYDVVTVTQSQMVAGSDSTSKNSTYSPMCNTHTTLPWSHGHELSERDCILSLIECDLCPPSPMSLTHSIDNALPHDNLGMGSLFTPPLPPPSWTQGLEPYCAQAGSATTAPATPTHIAYRWALDAGSSPVQDHCFGGSSHHSQPEGLDTQSPLSVKDLKLHLEESEQKMDPRSQKVTTAEDDWGSMGSTDNITDL